MLVYGLSHISWAEVKISPMAQRVGRKSHQIVQKSHPKYQHVRGAPAFRLSGNGFNVFICQQVKKTWYSNQWPLKSRDLKIDPLYTAPMMTSSTSTGLAAGDPPRTRKGGSTRIWWSIRSRGDNMASKNWQSHQQNSASCYLGGLNWHLRMQTGTQSWQG